MSTQLGVVRLKKKHKAPGVLQLEIPEQQAIVQYHYAIYIAMMCLNVKAKICEKFPCFTCASDIVVVNTPQ